MRILFFASLLMVASSASAGPFGLKQGMSLSELQKAVNGREVATEDRYVFKLSTPPVPSPHFNDYRLLVTPSHGLCKIVAWSPSIKTSVYGDSVKDGFGTLFDALSSKYGKSGKYDFLRNGSIWDEPRDWTMALLKEERRLAAFWSTENGSELPNEITAITLQAVGIRPDTALISVTYEFSNFAECAEWIKSQNDAGL